MAQSSNLTFEEQFALMIENWSPEKCASFMEIFKYDIPDSSYIDTHIVKEENANSITNENITYKLVTVKIEPDTESDIQINVKQEIKS